MKRKIKNSILFLLVAVLLSIGVGAYFKMVSPTRIAFVNYPEFIYTKIAKVNQNSFIKVDALKTTELKGVNKYDMLIVFGMGIKLPAEGEKQIKEASKSGTRIFLQSSTNPRLQLTNVKGKDLDAIQDYLDNGGKDNYKNLLNYIRRKIDGKKLFSDTIVAPLEIAADVLFYKEDDPNHEKVEDFEAYCLKNKIHKKGQDRVVLFTSVPGPFNANREHLNSLIDELQARGLNVYPISSFAGRMQYLQEIEPHLIVYLPHGRLSRGSEHVLKDLNVPVLSPLSVFQEHDKWLTDKMGMSGGILSQSVTMPEFDGGIVPYAVFAQYKDENGLLLFQAIPNRLKKFGEICKKYISLQKKKNSEKKLAIVYFKGPGQNALNAANLEVLPSLHNMLLHLKKEGYNLGDLPSNFATFKEIIMKKGPVLGPYAVGAFSEFIESGEPELIPVKDYENWAAELLPKDSYQDVVNRYGKAPGNYMGVYKNQQEYLAVARVKFGNVILTPQSLPGIGENQNALVHGAKIAPPHTYIAPYLWIQKGFKADAIFHFGTHGSLEFTPGKQIALSEYDWTDPLIGTTPHYYVYTISNVGEGMIAKRRSYAVTQTHLTPPFIEAQAFSGRAQLHEKMHKYDLAKGALKTEYALSIKKIVVEEGIHKDLGLDSILNQPYNDEEILKLVNYLEEVEHEKVTGGLYTMGVSYNKKQLNETVQLMMVDALAHHLSEIDLIKGKINEKYIENKMLFNDHYTHPCEDYIHEVIRTGKTSEVFNRLISKADQKRAAEWKKIKKAKNKGRRRGHPGMMTKQKNDSIASDAEKLQIRSLIIKILPNQEKKDFIEKLESDKEYEKSIALLDDANFAKAKKIARFIPAMRKSLETASDSSIHEILVLMQKPDLRKLALNYLKDKNLKQEVEQEKQRQNAELIAKALDKNDLQKLYISKNRIVKMQRPQLKKLESGYAFYSKNKSRLNTLLPKSKDASATKLNDFLNQEFAARQELISKRINELEQIEDRFAAAVDGFKKSLSLVLEKMQALKESPNAEFEAVLNSLNGGYTAPSTGGDPISNPSTLPTGRNLVAINAEKTPTKEAWKVGKKLGDQLLDDYKKKHGEYPEKISFTLWSSSFIESEGTTIGQILYILGVEPVWSAFGTVKDIKLIPQEELGRPRIDVVVQTSGQLRDLAASRLFLINKAIAKVAKEGGSKNNFVSKGVADAEKRLIEKGLSPKAARKLSSKRVFGGVNGNYGTGIMGMVENSGSWDSTKVVAQTYINNMGAVYGDEDEWGEFETGVFEAALLNTSAVVQPRQSNTWGALSLDHVYEFMGGLNLAIKEVTGNDAESYFNDFRNSSNARVQGLKEAIWVETRTTLLNKRYIKEYMKGGASSAETFAETFRNTFGWNVMKESVIEDRLWNKLYDTYIEDEQKLNIHEFFKKENPFALQEMTAVMLETVRKGMWKASKEQIATMAQLHAELVKDYDAGCSGFVCDNQKLKKFISEQINTELAEDYNQQIASVREIPADASKENVVLKKQEKIQPKAENASQFQINNWVVFSVIGLVLLLIAAFVLRRRTNK